MPRPPNQLIAAKTSVPGDLPSRDNHEECRKKSGTTALDHENHENHRALSLRTTGPMTADGHTESPSPSDEGLSRSVAEPVGP